MKRLVGKLLTYFGGLLALLGIAGIFAGTGSMLIIIPVFVIGFLMVTIGVAVRLI